MKRLTVVGCVAMLVSAAGVQAQTSANASLSSEVKEAYDVLKRNILRSAEKVPDSDYIFKPTPEIRSFAQVFGHVASAQMHTCAGILGQQAPSPATEANTKTNVLAALRESFAECDKAYDSLTDANATTMVPTFRGQRTRLAALEGNTIHDSEQYGILSVYLRLKGIIPPSSERPARK